MTILIRYKNNTLYNKSKQEFTTLEDVRGMKPGTYSVIESKTKKDITAEVVFLAAVDKVRRKGLWSKAQVVIRE
jgi:polyhydroxyalkanoate synthesis regulator protein